MLKKRRAEIEKDWMMVYRILFDYMFDPDYSRDKETVQAKKEKIANEALRCPAQEG